jgi:hypothetical protein
MGRKKGNEVVWERAIGQRRKKIPTRKKIPAGIEESGIDRKSTAPCQEAVQIL